jgi:hypothetical protein
MKRPILLLMAGVVACLAFAVPTQDSRSEDAKKIDLLARALEAQRKKTGELQLRVDRIEAWFAGMRAATEMLDSAANDARRNGFEQAGPNALARSNIIDGMKSFAAELGRNVPGPLPPLEQR